MLLYCLTIALLHTEYLGRSAPRHSRRNVLALDHHLSVVLGAGVGVEGLPIRHRLRMRPTLATH
jgi:hypothetical protein